MKGAWEGGDLQWDLSLSPGYRRHINYCVKRFRGQSCSGHDTQQVLGLGDENIVGLVLVSRLSFLKFPPSCHIAHLSLTRRSLPPPLVSSPTPKPLELLTFLGQEATLAAGSICPGLDLGRRASPELTFIWTLPLQQIHRHLGSTAAQRACLQGSDPSRPGLQSCGNNSCFLVQEAE